ncbi:glycosyltransferase family 2 protein [Gaoshiqia sediminis]|uniref:Hemolytic protein HlpA-like protein n=1 Tax=Gaoshiqia sediminis TaxID=2986998 RepID=A0AA41Y4A4_9BACT|nr:hypothetical protein [Gaoshiqia sediminis]MCW0483179.1 hypothetical protein [Gaoshiqia sediminis]
MKLPPILIIVFNRPDFALKLFEALAKLKPEKLYVISDGPRNEREAIDVEKSRLIFNNVDWNCQIKYDYSSVNIGLRQRITSGIDWVFQSEETLIILEDDCIPQPDFFKFCSSMLDRYADDNRIMAINGCNLNPRLSKTFPNSYFFSKYANSWGWATWKRAWDLFDRDLSGFDDKDTFKNFTYNFPYRTRSSLYWHYKMGVVKESKINSWAYRWMFSLWIQNGLAVVPKFNLIQNIGDDERSTNTKGNLHFLKIESSPIIEDELSHPNFIHANLTYDKWLEDSIYSKSLKYRLLWMIKKLTFQI